MNELENFFEILGIAIVIGLLMYLISLNKNTYEKIKDVSQKIDYAEICEAGN